MQVCLNELIIVSSLKEPWKDLSNKKEWKITSLVSLVWVLPLVMKWGDDKFIALHLNLHGFMPIILQLPGYYTIGFRYLRGSPTPSLGSFVYIPISPTFSIQRLQTGCEREVIPDPVDRSTSGQQLYPASSGGLVLDVSAFIFRHNITAYIIHLCEQFCNVWSSSKVPKSERSTAPCRVPVSVFAMNHYIKPEESVIFTRGSK